MRTFVSSACASLGVTVAQQANCFAPLAGPGKNPGADSACCEGSTE
jgi:hypothetical protein